jgi:hypothetical protein
MPTRVPASNSSIEDLREYVEAFRASSNRSRFALYVVMIASVLIGIATLNAHPAGWPLRRIDAWYGTPLDSSRFMGGDTVQLKIAREEYLKQFVARGVMTSSPIPGVSMDVNDLGLVGGTALLLLTLVQLFCLLREHENLQLALYKVRQLCVEDGEEHVRGDSRANLLYHALSMGQVLSSPPTLARWRRRGVLRHFGFIYFTPVVIQIWVLWNNWETRERGALYGADVVSSLAIQAVIALFIILLSGCALIVSRAMAKRWERAFYRVNPARWVAPQPSLLQWMKLRLSRRPEGTLDQLRTRIVTSLVDALTVADPREKGTVTVERKIEVRLERIHKRDMQHMLDLLYNDGEMAAKAWCSGDGGGTYDTLASFKPERSEYLRRPAGAVKADWVVRGTWTFYYVPVHRDEPAAQAASS